MILNSVNQLASINYPIMIIPIENGIPIRVFKADNITETMNFSMYLFEQYGECSIVITSMEGDNPLKEVSDDTR